MLEPPPRLPIAQAPLSVLLLAERSAAEAAAALAAWRSFLACLARPVEIVLVRPTQPAGAAEPFGTAYRVFRYDRSAGHGAALHDAIQAARHPLLAFSTADAQYAPQDLGRLLAVIDQCDLVLGIRTQPIPLWRTGLDRLSGLLQWVVLGAGPEPRRTWLGHEGWRRRAVARWLFGLRLHDPECPFRLCRRALFDRLPLQSRGPFIMVEMLAKANHMECLLAEEAVTWTPPDPPTEEFVSFRKEALAVFRRPEFRPPPAPPAADGPPAETSVPSAAVETPAEPAAPPEIPTPP